MARESGPPKDPNDPGDGQVVDIDVSEEMRNAFLEYSVSVIHSRALPDARDGLKPVQRRILYAMHELGLRPERGHVKSSRVVGETMGKYHPHGDQAIYDALVRMAQPFSMRMTLVDGHGNFGSLDAGPAAARYTEARLAPAAMLMVTGLDEETVDFIPNYDDQFLQPEVLPAAYPNLLVNGATGIAVGMATSMPPHNLIEVISAARHLLAHPNCSLDDLMKFVPGPDLPEGGKIVGLDGIREAYLTGRGTFRTRATAKIEKITPRKMGIVVTELPYLVGPEKVTAKIKELAQAKKLQGISDLKDLTDRKNGLRVVIEIKNGFNPEAVLEQLYRLTPLEDSFGINNVALVGGQPRTLGLKELLEVFVEFRLQVVRQRSEFRLGKRRDRLHLVEGLLIAILDIDEVIQIIRSSDDSDMARTRLMQVFDLSERQAEYILELRLRRLTKFSRIELEAERDELRAQIEELEKLLADESLLRKLVSSELAEVAKAHGTPRRTVLLESAGAPASVGAPLEVADDPCWVLLSSSGLLARTGSADPIPAEGGRAKHDAIAGAVRTSARGHFGIVTSAGRMVRVSALDLPTLVPTSGAPNLAGGTPAKMYVDLARGERILTLAGVEPGGPTLALGTAQGVVKRVVPDYPLGRSEWEVIALKPGDQVVGAAQVPSEQTDLVFISATAQLLRFPASSVRPQGRAAGGMAGIRLAPKDSVVFFGVVDAGSEGIVVTASGASDALPGTQAGAIKVAPYEEYPPKGRGTGGVRAHRFLKGEDVLVLAWAGNTPARASRANGAALELPAATGKRDGSGVAGTAIIAAIAGPVFDATPVLAGGDSGDETGDAPSQIPAAPERDEPEG